MLRRPPTLPWAPEEAADRSEKSATIPVAVIYIAMEHQPGKSSLEGEAPTIPNFLPSLSERYPVEARNETKPTEGHTITHRRTTFQPPSRRSLDYSMLCYSCGWRVPPSRKYALKLFKVL